MGDALSCLDDREEEKRNDQTQPPKPQQQPVLAQPGQSGGAQPAGTQPEAAGVMAATGKPATRRDGSVTRSNYRARSNSRAPGEGNGDGDGDGDGFATAAADASARSEDISTEKMDRARTVLRAAFKTENIEMIDKAILEAGKVLPTDELEKSQAQKRRMSRLQQQKAGVRVPASTPNLRTSGTTVAPTSKVPKTTAALTAPSAPDVPPIDDAAAAAAIEKLQQIVDERRLPELADAIAEAEAAGVGKKEPQLRKAKEMKEADTKRKEMARLRRAKERGEAN